MAAPAATPATRGVRHLDLRMAAAGAIGALAALFAAFNLDEVEVDWIVTSGSTPLIVVIAMSFLLGVAADRLAIRRRTRRRAAR